MRIKKNEKGSILLTGLIILVVLALIGWAFVYLTITLSTQAQQAAVSKQAYYAADAGIERTSMLLWEKFKACGIFSNKMEIFQEFIEGEQNAHDLDSTHTTAAGFLGDDIEYQTYIELHPLSTPDQIVVTIYSKGTSWTDRSEGEHFVRRISADVKYYLTGSPLFDFSYFANNFAWHSGDIRNGGSMGSNGWLRLKDGPDIAGGDRYDSCITAGGLDVVDKLDDGGIFAVRGFKEIKINNYSDTYPSINSRGYPCRHTSRAYFDEDNPYYDPNEPDTLDFEGIEMPSLASSEFYESYVLEEETRIQDDGGKYGIYISVPGGTDLYENDGSTLIRTTQDKEFIKISDAVYGDDINGNDSNTGYLYQDGKWIKGERENIILEAGSDPNSPLVIYGTVVVKGNVVVGDNYVDGAGAIYAGRNIYAAGNIEYKDKPVVTTSTLNSTLTGYRGFTGENDGDNFNPTGSGSPASSLTAAEQKQEDWLNMYAPSLTDSNATDLLGLFANESICIGNMGSSGDRDGIKNCLDWSGSLTIKKESGGTFTQNVNLNESDEAKLGSDQVPNTRIADSDSEYVEETNNQWDVDFYTTANPPPTDPNNSSLYAINPATGERFEIYNGDLPSGTPDSNETGWANAKKAVIPGSGEDLDGDGCYDNKIDMYDAIAFSEEDADYLRTSSASNKWNKALTFDPNEWGGNIDVMDDDYKTLGKVSGSCTRLDAITYTNHVWGGFLRGPVNGGLITRIEATNVSSPTSGCPLNHDDRVVGGGDSLRSTSILVPQTERMEVIGWRE